MRAEPAQTEGTPRERVPSAAQSPPDIIENGSDADALRAIEQICNRVYGKPRETVELEVKEPATVEEVRKMTREERRALLAQLEGEGRIIPLRPEEN